MGINAQIITVQVLASHPLAAEHLLKILAGDPDIRALHAADLQAATLAYPDVVLIDNADTPDRRPEVAARIVKTRCPDTKLAVLLPDTAPKGDDPATKLFPLITTGIRGLLRASKVDAHLIAMIHAVHGGHLYFPSDLLDIQAPPDGVLAQMDSAHVSLTPRERSVLALVQRRLSNREIAQFLGIRENTVKACVSEILSKLGTSSRHDLFAAAATH